MHKNNFYITFALWLIVMPFFGIPDDWKSILTSLSGLFLLVVFLGPAVFGKLHTKPKIKEEQKDEELKFSAPESNQVEEEKKNEDNK